jgi:predicted DNA-binding transcriptional regulator AlpA
MRGSKAVPQDEKPVRGELISMSEAAKRTGLSKRWIYYHMKLNTLPFPWFKNSIGKRFIDSADIDDYLRRCKILPGNFPGKI